MRGKADGDPSTSSALFILDGVSQMVLPDQLRHEHMFNQLPGVVHFQIPLPFHQVLQFVCVSEVSMVSDGFDFEPLFPLYKVRRRSHGADPVLIGLLIGAQ